MEGCEMSKLIQEEADNDDEETFFYQEAFQCFDWNHSGRIATSVSISHSGKIAPRVGRYHSGLITISVN